MEQACKAIQIKLLLSQVDDEEMKHISQCDVCWEAFMNIGVEEQTPEDADVAHKRKLFSKVTDPAYQGDHRMEQFQLLSSLEFTSYAKRVFLDYFTQLEQGRAEAKSRWPQAMALLEDTLYEKLQKKKREGRDPAAPIDAEVMMGVLDELGEPSSFLRGTSAQPTSSSVRRIYRSTEDRMIGGVCGGLAEYFRLDPILLRILFVGLLFIGGSSIMLYGLLFLFLPVKNKPQPVLSRGEEAPAEASEKKVQYSGFQWLRRLLFGVITFGLFSVIYIPLLFILGAISVSGVISVFHLSSNSSTLVIGSEALHLPLNLSQLGIPGVVAGCSLSLLFFSLFLLVLSFVLQLHFKKALLGKSLQAIFVVFVVMSFFSTLVSAGMVFAENREQATKTITRSFPLPKGQNLLTLTQAQLAPLKRSDIGVARLVIKTRKDAAAGRVGVKVTLYARGETPSKAEGALKLLAASWDKKGGYFPTIQKRGGLFRFEHAEIVLTVPQGLGLKLRDLSHSTLIQGRYGEGIEIHQKRGKSRLQGVQAPSVRFVGERGRLEIDGLEGKELHVSGRRTRVILNQVKVSLVHLKQERGRVSMSGIRAQTLSLRLRRSKLKGADVTGLLQLRSERSRVRLKLGAMRAGQHSIVGRRSRFRLYFPADGIPQRKITRNRSRVRDRKVRHLPTTKALLAAQLYRSRLRFATWEPRDTDQVLAPKASKPARTKAQPDALAAPVVPKRPVKLAKPVKPLLPVKPVKPLLPTKPALPRQNAPIQRSAPKQNAPTSRPSLR